MNKVRVDKWLWAIRIYKTRTLSSHQCKSNQVKVNGKKAKASTDVETGDVIECTKEGFHLKLEVTTIIEKRVGAAIAVKCYKDLTPEDEYKKFDNWFVGKGKTEFRDKGLGRPTKKERREIDKFKFKSN